MVQDLFDGKSGALESDQQYLISASSSAAKISLHDDDRERMQLVKKVEQLSAMVAAKEQVIKIALTLEEELSDEKSSFKANSKDRVNSRLQQALTRLQDVEYAARVQKSETQVELSALRLTCATERGRICALEAEVNALRKLSQSPPFQCLYDMDANNKDLSDEDPDITLSSFDFTAPVSKSILDPSGRENENMRVQLKKHQVGLALTRLELRRVRDEHAVEVNELRHELFKSRALIDEVESLKREKEMKVDNLIQELTLVKMQRVANPLMTQVATTDFQSISNPYCSSTNEDDVVLRSTTKTGVDKEHDIEHLVEELISSKMKIAACSGELEEERRKVVGFKKRIQLYAKKVNALELCLKETRGKMLELEGKRFFGFGM